MTVRATVFIPTSKNQKVLASCLKSLENQSDKNFEVMIVGKSKDEDIRKIITKFKKLKIHYFVQRSKGLVGAANEALKKSNKNYFIRLDDDAVAHKDWFKNILLTFKDAKVGAVTGPTLINREGFGSRDTLSFYQLIKNNDNSVKGLFAKFYYSYLSENRLFEVGKFLKSGVFTMGANFPDNARKKKNIEVENLEACNFACKTSLLKKIKGFDRIYENGLGEYHEADAAFKIRKLGYKIIFSPKVQVIHKVEQSAANSRPDAYHRIQNFIIFYKRYFIIDSFDTLARFSLNLIMQNLYYSFKFITTGKADQLKSIPGTFVGLYKNYVKNKHLYS